MHRKTTNKIYIHHKKHIQIRTSTIYTFYCIQIFLKFLSVIQHNCVSGITTHSMSQVIHSPSRTELPYWLRILVLIKICFLLGTTLEENFKKKIEKFKCATE